jgi:hypothetical protein
MRLTTVFWISNTIHTITTKMPIQSKMTISLPSKPSLQSIHDQYQPWARERSPMKTQEALLHALNVASLVEEALNISKDFYVSQSTPGKFYKDRKGSE